MAGDRYILPVSGRHASPKRALPILPVAAAVGVLVLGAGVVYAFVGGSDPADGTTGQATSGSTATASVPSTCGTGGPVRVAVAPELLTLVKAAADRVTAKDACAVYAVTPLRGPDAKVALTGAEKPDAWIPDTSTWLDTLPKDAAATWTPGASLATSPIGIVTATKAAPPASWRSVLYGQGDLLMADPDTDGASRLALYTAMGEGTEPLDLASGGRMILLSRFTTPSTTPLVAAFAKDASTARPFPLSEQAAFEHNAADPAHPLHLRVPAAGSMVLDYPVVEPASGANPKVEVLTTALTSEDGRAALEDAGFRRPDGTGGPTVAGEAPQAVPVVPLSSAAGRDRIRSQWHVLRTDMRMLAVIDLSGSMTWPSGTPGLSRWDVLRGAADRALQVMPPGSEVGARVFASSLVGRAQDWKELSPLARLDAKTPGGTHRDDLRTAIRTVKPYPKGDTGLYDSTLAAFRTMLSAWDANHVNSVVVMTDGENDDPAGGIDLPGLLAALKKEFRQDRPVRIVTIGMGEADPGALQKISAATGGTSYIANSPSDIDRVLVQALLARPLPVSS